MKTKIIRYIKMLAGRGVFLIAIAILLLLTYSYLWCASFFPSISFDAIVFQLSVPLKGTSSQVVNDYMTNALYPALQKMVLCGVVCVKYWLTGGYEFILTLIRRGKQRFIQFRMIRIPVVIIITMLIIWFEVLWVYADRRYGLNSYIAGRVHESKFIESEYVDPKSTKIYFPEEKRNLIWIIMESAETSAQSEVEGGIQPVNFIPQMTRLAQENVSFSQSELVEGAVVTPGAGWTIAGIVGESAGIPLKIPIEGNSMSQYETFMPKLVNLGDILEDNGYHNYFMCGSDLDFAGRSNYFHQHGNYETFDYHSAIKEGKINPDYYVWWGFEDCKLYSYAKEKILDLAGNDEPFNFTMLTVDTHHVGGYVCELCKPLYNEQYGNVWACADEQVNEFVSWIQEQDFYKNTTIVITGDHCSMDPGFYAEFDTPSDGMPGTRRRVYNAFINAPVVPVKEKNRRFTTLDMFPTIMAGIGAKIDGERLGLGTNLFSDKETLAEEYGYDKLFEGISLRSSFYNKKILY